MIYTGPERLGARASQSQPPEQQGLDMLHHGCLLRVLPFMRSKVWSLGFLQPKGHGKKVKWPPVTGPFLTLGKHKDKLACLLFPSVLLRCLVLCVWITVLSICVWTVLSSSSQSKVEHCLGLCCNLD